ncbi:DNA-3-methyladenine glycosylase 2 family protein [Marinicella rhabdoformis]|uniref:DNA-3-methyladenine glycosylase 2 family protein n=1 Tax=Marinicella rhabdoformis TaxID=2580566 RepID=UPI0012AED038|nr:AlkA N-terminal domain-containing protein [Marinicella rhabdoformis]
MLDTKTCQLARLSRDARFDGQFFTGVKTTGIFCRCICPATPPKESNVDYYPTAIAAAKAGFRPCLRCRPDSAPHSPAWNGVGATVERAMRLIHQGALESGSLAKLADDLGISDRYLRQVFNQHVGVSPKKYALYQQCLFAKQLLHQTQLPVTEVALASGFNSVRRFNDCLLKQLHLNPTQIRKNQKAETDNLQLKLAYRPPYDWQSMQQFLSHRVIAGLEWIDANSYGRTFEFNQAQGQFTAHHIADKNRFNVDIEIDDLSQLKNVVNNIRRVLDLDVDILAVENHLSTHFASQLTIHSGLRLPGTWSLFEAGIRAILGQQISVTAAMNLVTTLVDQLGESQNGHKLFPTAKAIANSSLDFFKMPGSRKQTLKNLAHFVMSEENNDDPNDWLALKGIGPWTVDYAKMRGLSDPDIFLGGDLGVQKAMANEKNQLSPDQAKPWRSYLTFQLWSQL